MLVVVKSKNNPLNAKPRARSFQGGVGASRGPQTSMERAFAGVGKTRGTPSSRDETRRIFGRFCHGCDASE
jgi:hypothetical protein